MAIVKNLELELLKLENKVRFILDVVEGNIIVSNRKKADLFLELKEKGFTPFPKKKSIEAVVAGSVDDTEEAEEDLDEVINKGVRGSDYDYLLAMAIGTLTVEKVQELHAERDKLKEDVADMRKATPKALWMKDLDALEQQLDEEDKNDAIAEQARKGSKYKVESKAGAVKVPRRAPKATQKNKAATNAEPTTEPMDMSTSSVVETDVSEVAKPKGRAGAKKAPTKKGKSSSVPTDDDDDDDESEVQALRLRLAAHSISSSPETSDAMAIEEDTEVQAQRKEPSRRAAAQKKPLSSVTEISDDKDDVDVSDEDFELEVITEVEAKKGGKKAGNNKAAKPPVATKKRGPANKQSQLLGQKLITEVLKPAENVGISPEKKVRKMRASPFNKKSGSVLGRTSLADQDMNSTDSEEQVSPDSASGSTEGTSEAFVAPRARPQRANRGKTTYVLSDSESDDAEDDEDFDGDDD